MFATATKCETIASAGLEVGVNVINISTRTYDTNKIGLNHTFKRILFELDKLAP
jgi:hypothetical protein